LCLLLGTAGTLVVLYEPQRLVTHGVPGRLPRDEALVAFTLAYGLCTTAFVPRPVLSVAAGALFGGQAGTVAAVVGTVIGSAIAFMLGRVLGQEALRPLLRTRWLTAADHQLSRYGFRTMLLIRLMPGLPFAGCNYAAAVSRMTWPAFLAATTIGVAPNTAAYVVAGARAASPTSPAFLAAFAFIALSGLGGAFVAWRKRAALRGAPAQAAQQPAASTTSTQV
jgi:uncharacterized membrane protein YdjX (TVP38/TMEM64 family)